MKTTTDKIGLSSFFRLALLGLAAGFANGLLGAGGGILIVFGLSPLLSSDLNGSRDVFANALAVMLPISVVSVISYMLKGRFDTDAFGLYVIPAVIGGFTGAILLDKLKLSLIKKLFAILVIWSGVYLIMR